MTMILVVYISLFPFLISISLCILSCVALFLVYIHNMDTIIRPTLGRAHILDIVSAQQNSDHYQLVLMLYGESIYLCKSIFIVSNRDRIRYSIYII